MKVSLPGMLRNVGASVRRSPGDRRVWCHFVLHDLETCLRAVRDTRDADTLVSRWLPRGFRDDVIVVRSSLVSRPTRTTPQPGLAIFGLTGLIHNIDDMIGRSAEGSAVIEEFFRLYVFEDGKDVGEETS